MRRPSGRLVLAILLSLVLVIVALTDSRSSNVLKTRSGAKGVAADRAFVELMVPVDRRAIALARIARARAQQAALRSAAARLIEQRRGEIRVLLREAPPIEAQVPPGAVPPLEQGSADSGALSLVPFDAGLGVRSADLRHKARVNQPILNRMIRLAQGTIRMARAELSEGSVPRLKRFSNRVLRDRFDQIFRLNAWYVRWYGRASRAGGIPAGA